MSQKTTSLGPTSKSSAIYRWPYDVIRILYKISGCQLIFDLPMKCMSDNVVCTSMSDNANISSSDYCCMATGKQCLFSAPARTVGVIDLCMQPELLFADSMKRTVQIHPRNCTLCTDSMERIQCKSTHAIVHAVHRRTRK